VVLVVQADICISMADDDDAVDAGNKEAVVVVAGNKDAAVCKLQLGAKAWVPEPEQKEVFRNLGYFRGYFCQPS